MRRSLTWRQWLVSYVGALALGGGVWAFSGNMWIGLGAGAALMVGYVFMVAAPEKPSSSQAPPAASSRQLRRQQARRVRKDM